MHNIKKILALVLVAVSVLSFSGCLKYTSNILEFTTRPDQPVNTPGEMQTTTIYITENTTQAPSVNIEVQTTLPQEITTAAPEQTTAAPVIVPEVTTAPAEKDPASWTTAEILEYITEAVTKTKAYTSKVTVDHKESFTANVTKAPGGSFVMNIANGIIGGVVKPTDEVLTFNGGQTVNSEGETVPLLLPKRGAFTLTAAGVASASAKKNGAGVQISIKLVEELGTLTTVPKHNAASVGYLDIGSVDLGVVTLKSIDIKYVGSTLDVVINEDGYVTNAVYKIPVNIACEGSAMGINASIECVGEQSETWKINW